MLVVSRKPCSRLPACHYFLAGPRLPSQLKSVTALGRCRFILLGEDIHIVWTYSQRKGSKSKRRVCVGRTASKFAVRLTQTTASDSSGDEKDFGNCWKRSDGRTGSRTKRDRTELFRSSVFVWFAIRTQTKQDKTNSLSEGYLNFRWRTLKFF